MAKDLWEEMSEQEVAAPPSMGGGSEIPDKLNFIVETCTEANGKAAPQVKNLGDSGTFFKFKTGVIVKGGVAAGEPFNGRYIFLDMTVHKPTPEMIEKWMANADEAGVKRLKGQLEALPKLPLNGDLYNLILDTLAPEGETIQDRYRQAMGILRPSQEDLAAANGDKELMLAIKFKTHLLTNSYTVIGRTYTPKQKEGKTFVPSQTLGSIEAFTPATATKRKVKLYEDAF